MSQDGIILLNVSEETSRWNKLALEAVERERLAERLASRFGEHVLHDCTGRVLAVEEGFISVVVRARHGTWAYVKIRADYCRFAGVENKDDHFSCQVTTRARRILNDAPIFQPPKLLPVQDIYNFRRVK